MKRPNVNILYICVIFALITLFSCKGKGGTYRDGVFYPNDEKLAGSKKVTKPDGHEYIMFYNRDGTPQSGEGMHHTAKVIIFHLIYKYLSCIGE